MVSEVSAMTDELKAALLVVDIQKDFCAGGALAAPGGVEIIPAVNRHVADAGARGMPVYATRDWHPVRTTHFTEYGGNWPPHCVQGTAGAQFHPALQLPPDAIIVNKGDDPQRHGYSAFEGHTSEGKTLLEDLRARHITRVYVAGIATDYCVRQSALDALRAGLEVRVLPDAIAGIDVRPGDAQRALDEISAAGAELVPTLDAERV
jgi:nicotinamidase/pyrazinamidase